MKHADYLRQMLAPLGVYRLEGTCNGGELEAVGAALDPYLIANAAARANLVVTMKYALVLVASLPMLILYPFIQKYFVKGVMIGSVKG